MRLLSPILQRIIYPALGSVGYFHSRSAAAVSVVTYHGLLPEGYERADPFLDGALVTTSAFRAQLRLLKAHYNVVSPEQFRCWLITGEKLPERPVLLTCDDGLVNNVTIMLPILQQEQLSCLFFVTGAGLQQAPAMLWYVELYLMLMQIDGRRAERDWHGMLIPAIPADLDEKRDCWFGLVKILSRLHAPQRSAFLRDAKGFWRLNDWKRLYLDDPLLRQRFHLLTAAEVKHLFDAGMTVGAHTMTHPVLSEQPEEAALDEIRDCRRVLETCTTRPVWALAYPSGDPDSVGCREYALAEAAGYDCAFLNVGGSVDSTFSRFALPRIHVTADMSLAVFEAHISDFHHSLQSVFRRK